MGAANFSVSKYMKLLLDEGEKEGIDDTEDCELPDFYDEDKYKRGQAVFHKYFASMMLGKLFALAIGLAEPKLMRILRSTNMSSEPRTANKRYAMTIKHVLIWYDTDLRTDTVFWESLRYVRRKHDRASDKCAKIDIGPITQRDLVIAQCAFIGVTICEPEILGMGQCSEAEFEDFLYVWNVIGRIIGIQDRFNICQYPFKQAREICSAILRDVLLPEVQKNSQEYEVMRYALVNGLKRTLPILNYDTFLSAINIVIKNLTAEKSKSFSPIAWLKLLESTIYRFIINSALTYWLRFFIKYPIIAYYTSD